jgi:LPS export ABC transporter protein LptC
VISRVLFAVLALGALGTLFYLSDNGNAETTPADIESTEPGYIATGAELIETGDDGHPLYRLDAERIEQPTPQGVIFVTAPKLDYQPEADNHWTLTAERGQMPQDARTAELTGSVRAEGKPNGSDDLMHITTDQLHLDMAAQLVTTTAKVRVDWGRNSLRGRGMTANIKDDRLQLGAEVHGALVH